MIPISKRPNVCKNCNTIPQKVTRLPSGWIIRCETCGISGKGPSVEEALVAWDLKNPRREHAHFH